MDVTNMPTLETPLDALPVLLTRLPSREQGACMKRLATMPSTRRPAADRGQPMARQLSEGPMCRQPTRSRWTNKAPALCKARMRILKGWRADCIRNPIREIMEDAGGKENPDKALISLANSDPTAYPQFRPCQQMVDAVVAAMTTGSANGYQPSQGNLACRQAVAEHYSQPGRAPLAVGDVFMTLGGSDALSQCIAALAAEGGNMLLPRPGWPLYEVLCQYHGLEVRYYDLLPESNWEIDLAMLSELADEKTCALLLQNPSNPCGAVFSREHLEGLMREAESLMIPIIADENYGGMSFDYKRPFVPCAAVSPRVPVLSVCALSKRWLAPGWRVGWVTVHDADDAFKEAGIQETLLKLCQLSMGPSAPLQAAVPDILRKTPKSWYESIVGVLEDGAWSCTQRAKRVPGLRIPSAPSGAMYLMVQLEPGALEGIGDDDAAFAAELLREESVAVLPGTCFGAPGFFRVVFTAPNDALDEAWRRIEAFCRRRSSAGA